MFQDGGLGNYIPARRPRDLDFLILVDTVEKVLEVLAVDADDVIRINQQVVTEVVLFGVNQDFA
jgi:hypothetical protein